MKLGVNRTLANLLRISCSLTDRYTARTCAVYSATKGTAIVTVMKVPKTGGLPTTKVNVVRWLKNEGDSVRRGDAVVELETEKVNYELDAPADGILLKILAREGTEVPVGEAVCHIGQPGDALPQH